MFVVSDIMLTGSVFVKLKVIFLAFPHFLHQPDFPLPGFDQICSIRWCIVMPA